MEDTDIIRLYWARDEGAIAATDEKYGTLCRSLSHNILASREDAEECVNDTWHRAWNTMPPQRPASLRAYLVRLVRNLSIDRWRARKSQKRGEGLEALVLELEDCVPAAPSAEEETQRRGNSPGPLTAGWTVCRERTESCLSADTGTGSGWVSCPVSWAGPQTG